METSQFPNGSANWLNLLQGALGNESESSHLIAHQVLAKDSGFLKAVLIGFLSMIDGNCVFSGVEITRFLDLDYLKGIPDDSQISFKVVQDYSTRNYLQITVRDRGV